jgi:hypothetical protein
MKVRYLLAASDPIISANETSVMRFYKFTERQVSALVDLKTTLENKKWIPAKKRA